MPLPIKRHYQCLQHLLLLFLSGLTLLQSQEGLDSAGFQQQGSSHLESLKVILNHLLIQVLPP